MNVVVIGGMAKTGTTLPLTLLDSHPSLLVFPEELRFFPGGETEPDPTLAAEQFLSNPNTQMLRSQNAFFDETDFAAHRGTGFGARDYTGLDFDVFSEAVRAGFAAAGTDAATRFDAIIAGFAAAVGVDPDADLTFVCKSPNNELHAARWVRTLGERGRYIVCSRDPFEHLLTLQEGRKRSGKATGDVTPWFTYTYAENIRSRRRYWDLFPADQLFVLDYDGLLGDLRPTMQQLCEFIGVPFDEVVLHPTKFGVPWSGNSARGIVSSEVFANPKIARDTLSPRVQRLLERNLASFLEERGYASEPIPPARAGEKAEDLAFATWSRIKRTAAKVSHRA